MLEIRYAYINPHPSLLLGSLYCEVVMAEASSIHLVSAKHFKDNLPFTTIPSKKLNKSTTLPPPSLQITSLSRKHHRSPVGQRGGSKAPRRLITVSPSEGRWHGKWNSEYLVSLRDLHLEDLVEDGHTKADVSINLSIQRHASFGLSVDGRIVTSFTRKCSICSSPYCRQIDTNFTVWVLPTSRDNRATQIPEIGGDDPSVIYVRPGYEANLDSLVQDTIRLTTSAKDTCSELCENSEPTLQYFGGQNAASVDKRWSRLLELKNTYHL